MLDPLAIVPWLLLWCLAILSVMVVVMLVMLIDMLRRP